MRADSPEPRANSSTGIHVTGGMGHTPQGRVVADFLGDRGRVCLVAYSDESWGIVRGGEIVSTWGPEDTADCVMAFVQMGGFDASVAGMGVNEGRRGTPSFHDRPVVAVSPGRLMSDLWGGDEYRYN